MLLLYLVLLGALAVLTAYTRNFQRTIVALGNELDQGAGSAVTPRTQLLRTLAVAASWPVAFGLGLLFIAWWKAVALVVGAFVLLVPTLGSLTPRAMSPHYLCRIRTDLEHRLAAGEGDRAQLRALLARLDGVITRQQPDPSD